jgi:hypothetical protein
VSALRSAEMNALVKPSVKRDLEIALLRSKRDPLTLTNLVGCVSSRLSQVSKET